MDASSPMLNFNHLRTSNGDRYICSFNINIPESMAVSGQALINLVVMSKLLYTLRLQLFAGTFFSGFVLFYVSLVLNFAIFESVRI